MRFLCLSDIHGHAAALSAVLATAERSGYGRILVAGDICFPGPEPLKVWRRLSQLNALCVQGVGDRAIATVDIEELRPRDDYEAARLGRLREVRRELGDVILNRLAKLPRRIRQPLGHDRQLLLVHGSPLDPMEPITHDMDDVTVSHLLADDPADVVLCGGSHVPFDRVVARQGDDVPSHTRVINLGSVGEAPAGEGVGGPTQTTNWAPLFAHATFVESKDGGIDVEQFVVPLGRAA
ncbi:MAG TPA: metallophosphoesterase [Polyangiaceae bacterium]|nr:metallophosphoesterase [Polyangiaceae bacterium]